MKLKIFESTLNDLRCVKCLAIIPKSKKRGIHRKYQKTWSVKTVNPEVTIKESSKMFEAEAKRWEAKIMSRIRFENDPVGALPSHTTTPSVSPQNQPAPVQPAPSF